MKRELEKVYDPKQVEEKLYKIWMEQGYFGADVGSDKPAFSIVMPPPNITGQLHMGHALDCTFQDILTRFNRMDGKEALWIPGTDHASIATEAKIVQALAEQGVSKFDLGRDGFLEKAWEWKETYGGRINAQQKKMGISCDWDRECFTMDEDRNKAVTEFFNRLYEKGYIYRGERIINWCPDCMTSISDAEVDYNSKDGFFWHIKYPLADGSGHLEIATTRPETMLGDTGVAVHPEDERYAHLIGKTIIVPLVNREVPIVADTYVEKDFGTGCVKMTPAHDMNDFEVGQRQNLETLNVMNKDASINANGGKYAGLDRFEARKAIVEDLKAGDFLIKIEPYTHNVGCCSRCSTVVEPLISTQWFLKMSELAAPAIKAVRSGEVKFVPQRFDQTFFHWMENIKDWCISRQLWWGQRIPAWYCQECGEITVAREAVTACCKCGSSKVRQDEDTLDTWFSSALWPFSTMGWPENTADINKFFPTTVLVTGYDIIFFWVCRMVFASLEMTGKIPFETVFIHGIVRDAQGRKMSKSLGNGIDPLEVIEQYGADALRLSLTMGVASGADMRFGDEKIKVCRNFANKLWNATRFIHMNIGDEAVPTGLPANLEIEDKWILSTLNSVIKEVRHNLDVYELGIAVGKIYDFSWDVFCDWYIELAKSRLMGEDSASVKQVLVYVLGEIMKLLHPFMPFITEELWSSLPNNEGSIMVSDYPVYKDELNFDAEKKSFEIVMEAIKAIRNARTNANVPPSKKATVHVISAHKDLFLSSAPFIQKLAFASNVTVEEEGFDIKDAVRVVTSEATILIPLNELIDRDKELARLTKELETCEKDIAFVSGKLNNAGFVAKAPEAVIKAEQEKLLKATERYNKVKESLKALGV